MLKVKKICNIQQPISYISMVYILIFDFENDIIFDCHQSIMISINGGNPKLESLLPTLDRSTLIFYPTLYPYNLPTTLYPDTITQHFTHNTLPRHYNPTIYPQHFIPTLYPYNLPTILHPDTIPLQFTHNTLPRHYTPTIYPQHFTPTL